MQANRKEELSRMTSLVPLFAFIPSDPYVPICSVQHSMHDHTQIKHATHSVSVKLANGQQVAN
jgi:hypothetical protein